MLDSKKCIASGDKRKAYDKDKKEAPPPSTEVKSKKRESLDSRIERMLSQPPTLPSKSKPQCHSTMRHVSPPPSGVIHKVKDSLDSRIAHILSQTTPVPKQWPINENLQTKVKRILKLADGKIFDVRSALKQIEDVTLNEARSESSVCQNAHLKLAIPIKGDILSNVVSNNSLEKTDLLLIQDKDHLITVMDEPPTEDDNMSICSVTEGEITLDFQEYANLNYERLPNASQKTMNQDYAHSVPNATYSIPYSSQSSDAAMRFKSNAEPYSASFYSKKGDSIIYGELLAPASASYPVSTPISAPSPSGSLVSNLWQTQVSPSATHLTSVAMTYPPLPPPPYPSGSALCLGTDTPQYPAREIYSNTQFPTSAQSSAIHNIHSIYTSEHVQMMAHKGIRWPGVGFAMTSTPPDSTSSLAANLQIPNAAASITVFPPHRLLTKSSYSAGTVLLPSPPNIAEMVMHPPPGYPKLPRAKQEPSPFHVLSHFSLPTPDPSDPHASTVNGVFIRIIEELKQVLEKDINKRAIEVVAFKRFDDWWENNLQEMEKNKKRSKK